MGRFGVELLLIAFAAIVVTGFIVTYVEPIDHVQYFYVPDIMPDHKRVY